MAFDIAERISELTERQKELVLTKHNILETIERADAARDQQKQIDKEIAWIAGALDALRVWQQEMPEKAMGASAEPGGWGKAN